MVPNRRFTKTNGASPLQNATFGNPQRIRSNPERTKERIRCLEEYIRKNLLPGDGSFICEHFTQCRGSRSGLPFHHGQMSHVGRHYDLEVAGRPMRIVLVGQEYGKTQECVGLAKRSERIALSAGKGFQGRNRHMGGTSSILRLLLGREPGADEAGERLLDGHVFDGFALVNYLLCTALKKPRNREQDACGGGEGHSSPIMRRNCGRHFRRTLEILEPTVIVAQGIGVGKWMSKALPIAEQRGPHHEMIRITGQSVDLFTFSHPSAGGSSGFWGRSPRSPYLMKTVAPVIREFLVQKIAE